jgi:hypothetical protein
MFSQYWLIALEVPLHAAPGWAALGVLAASATATPLTSATASTTVADTKRRTRVISRFDATAARGALGADRPISAGAAEAIASEAGCRCARDPKEVLVRGPGVVAELGDERSKERERLLRRRACERLVEELIEVGACRSLPTGLSGGRGSELG